MRVVCYECAHWLPRYYCSAHPQGYADCHGGCDYFDQVATERGQLWEMIGGGVLVLVTEATTTGNGLPWYVECATTNGDPIRDEEPRFRSMMRALLHRPDDDSRNA